MERPSRLIYLRAVDPARNFARDYSIWMTVDLFGQWMVETRWGRIGGSGSAKPRLPDALSRGAMCERSSEKARFS